MAGRTFAVGDIHGDIRELITLLARLPPLDAQDTLVFLGDYIDRGPHSRQVVDYLRALPNQTAAQVVFLRGNHEDGWLRVLNGGWPQFVLPPTNGTHACLYSYLGLDPDSADHLSTEDYQKLMTGEFFPGDVVSWMQQLPHWYEDDHAIYVHAGLPYKNNRFLHPSEVEDPIVLLWLRSEEFFLNYNGKLVVCGHTATDALPDLSEHTPGDNTDLWKRGSVIAIDTKCSKPGGFLTAVELPEFRVYESRN